MKLIKALFRILGWLLTPLVAWAASFGGAWLGAAVSSGAKSTTTTLWVTVITGFVSAILGALVWLQLLRRSPKLQQTLALAPDGTPLVALTGETPKDGP